MTIDKVFPLKIESTTAGDDTNYYPTSLDPNEDYIASRGIALQDNATADDLVLIERVAVTDELQFTDAVCGTHTFQDVSQDLSRFYFQDDFGGSAVSTKFTRAATGTGTGSGGANIAYQGGAVQLTCGNVANDYYQMSWGSSTAALLWITPAMNPIIETRMRWDQLVQATDTYIYWGIYESSGTENRIVFRQGTASGAVYWRAYTVLDDVETKTDLPTPPVSGTWYTLKIVIAAASVLFYQDGVLVATHTTNIPDGTQPMRPTWLVQTIGAANRSISVDYFSMRLDRGAA